jgi:hypothetical protein
VLKEMLKEMHLETLKNGEKTKKVEKSAKNSRSLVHGPLSFFTHVGLHRCHCQCCTPYSRQ